MPSTPTQKLKVSYASSVAVMQMKKKDYITDEFLADILNRLNDGKNIPKIVKQSIANFGVLNTPTRIMAVIFTLGFAYFVFKEQQKRQASCFADIVQIVFERGISFSNKEEIEKTVDLTVNILRKVNQGDKEFDVQSARKDLMNLIENSANVFIAQGDNEDFIKFLNTNETQKSINEYLKDISNASTPPESGPKSKHTSRNESIKKNTTTDASEPNKNNIKLDTALDNVLNPILNELIAISAHNITEHATHVDGNLRKIFTIDNDHVKFTGLDGEMYSVKIPEVIRRLKIFYATVQHRNLFFASGAVRDFIEKLEKGVAIQNTAAPPAHSSSQAKPKEIKPEGPHSKPRPANLVNNKANAGPQQTMLLTKKLKDFTTFDRSGLGFFKDAVCTDGFGPDFKIDLCTKPEEIFHRFFNNDGGFDFKECISFVNLLNKSDFDEGDKIHISRENNFAITDYDLHQLLLLVKNSFKSNLDNNLKPREYQFFEMSVKLKLRLKIEENRSTTNNYKEALSRVIKFHESSRGKLSAATTDYASPLHETKIDRDGYLYFSITSGEENMQEHFKLKLDEFTSAFEILSNHLNDLFNHELNESIKGDRAIEYNEVNEARKVIDASLKKAQERVSELSSDKDRMQSMRTAKNNEGIFLDANNLQPLNVIHMIGKEEHLQKVNNHYVATEGNLTHLFSDKTDDYFEMVQFNPEYLENSTVRTHDMAIKALPTLAAYTQENNLAEKVRANLDKIKQNKKTFDPGLKNRTIEQLRQQAKQDEKARIIQAPMELLKALGLPSSTVANTGETCYINATLAANSIQFNNNIESLEALMKFADLITEEDFKKLDITKSPFMNNSDWNLEFYKSIQQVIFYAITLNLLHEPIPLDILKYIRTIVRFNSTDNSKFNTASDIGDMSIDRLLYLDRIALFCDRETNAADPLTKKVKEFIQNNPHNMGYCLRSMGRGPTTSSAAKISLGAEILFPTSAGLTKPDGSNTPLELTDFGYNKNQIKPSVLLKHELYLNRQEHVNGNTEKRAKSVTDEFAYHCFLKESDLPHQKIFNMNLAQENTLNPMSIMSFFDDTLETPIDFYDDKDDVTSTKNYKISPQAVVKIEKAHYTCIAKVADDIIVEYNDDAAILILNPQKPGAENTVSNAVVGQALYKFEEIASAQI